LYVASLTLVVTDLLRYRLTLDRFDAGFPFHLYHISFLRNVSPFLRLLTLPQPFPAPISAILTTLFFSRIRQNPLSPLDSDRLTLATSRKLLGLRAQDRRFHPKAAFWGIGEISFLNPNLSPLQPFPFLSPFFLLSFASSFSSLPPASRAIPLL